MSDSSLPQTEISLTNCLSLVYRDLNDVCTLTLCSATVITEFTYLFQELFVFCSFFGMSYKDNPFAYKYGQFFFLSNVNASCSFSSLIAIARISIMTLIQSGFCVHLCCCYLLDLLPSPSPCQGQAGREGRAIPLYDSLLYHQR